MIPKAKRELILKMILPCHKHDHTGKMRMALENRRSSRLCSRPHHLNPANQTRSGNFNRFVSHELSLLFDHRLSVRRAAVAARIIWAV
jgi:hypothetical protein